MSSSVLSLVAVKFSGGILKTAIEKWFDALLVALVALHAFLSHHANIWDALTLPVWVLCSIIALHVLRATVEVWTNRHTLQISSVLIIPGIEQGQQPHFEYLMAKLVAIACLMLLLLAIPSYMVKYFASENSHQSVFVGGMEARLMSSPTLSANLAHLIVSLAGQQCMIEPIQQFMFLRITNNETREKMITEYFVEVGWNSKNRWVRLKRLDLRSGNLIMFAKKGQQLNPPFGRTIDFPSGNTSNYSFLMDPTNTGYEAALVLRAPLLDSRIGGSNLLPGQSISGWSAFQYMKADLGGPDVRITVKDEQGETHSIISEQQIAPSDTNIAEHLIVPVGRVDASRCQVGSIF